MHVKGFMVPKEQVHVCTEWDTIHSAMETLLDKKISAVVVIDKDGKPVGILTKTDCVRAYHEGVSHSQKVGLIMVKDVDTVLETDSRDQAASLFEHNHHHHAIVVDKDGHMVGLISAWDIARECSRDAKAWPWLRQDDGKVHP